MRRFFLPLVILMLGGAVFAVAADRPSVDAQAGRCNGQTVTISGTAAGEVLRGTRGSDVISGGGGNDRIFGRGGNDVICGGAGNDVIKGGAGNDKLSGDRGNDRLVGGAGRDRCLGRAGRDSTRTCETGDVAPTPTPNVPQNPGDTRNCSDFATQAEAQAWFDLYFPHYGDIARLDADGNGIACESLP